MDARLQALIGAAANAHRAGRLDEAERGYREALRLAPNTPDALHLLGLVHHQRRDHAAAVKLIADAIALNPRSPAYHFNLGNAEYALGRRMEAAAAFRAEIALNPGFLKAHNNLGNVLLEGGAYGEAAAAFQSALSLDPNAAEIVLNLAAALDRLGRRDAALEQYHRALSLRPNFVAAHVGVAGALLDGGQFDEAQSHLEAALSLDPNSGGAWQNLGLLLGNAGDASGAVRALQRAAVLAPDNNALALAVITAQNLDSETTAVAAVRTRRDWAARFADPLAADVAPLAAAKSGRPLRVAYLGGDTFRFHTGAMALLPIIEGHDPRRVEAYCYSDTSAAAEDGVTVRFRSAARYHCVAGFDDEAVARLVREHNVDVAVDTFGHPPGSRLGVLARRVAPVQISLLTTGTTGMRAMDYVIGDPILVPRSMDGEFTERIVRLPIAYVHTALGDPPTTMPSPFDRNGYVTFGCFQQLRKISPQALGAWAQILSAVPRSRLVLHLGATQPGFVEKLARKMNEAGLPRERVDMAPWAPTYRDHLAGFGAVDIALDTFPYGGVTTTCEALLMGVPVVTLCGDRVLGRYSATFLGAVGLADLAAATPEIYVAAAVELANDSQRRGKLRRALRARLLQSRICDGRRMARNLERVYRAAHSLRRAVPR